MGMDVIGKSPDSESGEYFRNNVWWWRPLWDYCERVAPVARKVKNAQFNDGGGLNAKDSVKLAEVLEAEVSSGRCKEYSDQYEAHMNSLPDEPCEYCNKTGIRQWPDGPQTCNACGGKGTVRPFGTHYPFSVENVQEFTEFLRHCGGFEIW